MKSYLLAPQHSNWRWLVILALLVVTGAHLPVISPHLQEAPYMGALFIVLSGACVLLAAVMLNTDSRASYALSVLTCALAIIGYVATRSVQFPMLADDVGNWLEPLGVTSIAAEAVVVLAAVFGLRAAPRPLPPPTRPSARPATGMAAPLAG